jgi:hypothetical protein
MTQLFTQSDNHLDARTVFGGTTPDSIDHQLENSKKKIFGFKISNSPFVPARPTLSTRVECVVFRGASTRPTNDRFVDRQPLANDVALPCHCLVSSYCLIQSHLPNSDAYFPFFLSKYYFLGFF